MNCKDTECVIGAHASRAKKPIKAFRKWLAMIMVSLPDAFNLQSSA